MKRSPAKPRKRDFPGTARLHVQLLRPICAVSNLVYKSSTACEKVCGNKIDKIHGALPLLKPAKCADGSKGSPASTASSTTSSDSMRHLKLLPSAAVRQGGQATTPDAAASSPNAPRSHDGPLKSFFSPSSVVADQSGRLSPKGTTLQTAFDARASSQANQAVHPLSSLNRVAETRSETTLLAAKEPPYSFCPHDASKYEQNNDKSYFGLHSGSAGSADVVLKDAGDGDSDGVAASCLRDSLPSSRALNNNRFSPSKQEISHASHARSSARNIRFDDALSCNKTSESRREGNKHESSASEKCTSTTYKNEFQRLLTAGQRDSNSETEKSWQMQPLFFSFFPLFFSDSSMEQEYASLTARRMPVKVSVVTPILVFLFALSYYIAAHFCLSGLCTAYIIEVTFSEIAVLAAPIIICLPLLKKRSEICVVGIYSLTGVYRSLMRLVTLALHTSFCHGNFSEFIPFYASAGIFENFVFCFFITFVFGIRFAYCLWSFPFLLTSSAAVGVYSLIVSAKTSTYILRFWTCWSCAAHLSLLFLMIFLFIFTYHKERTKRLLLGEWRTALDRLLAVKQRTAIDNQIYRRALSDQAVACITRNIIEAQKQLEKEGPTDNALVSSLLESAVGVLAPSTQIYDTPDTLSTQFSCSFVKNFLLLTSSARITSGAISASLRRRSAFLTSDFQNAVPTWGFGRNWDLDFFEIAETTTSPLVMVGTSLLLPFSASPDVRICAETLRRFLHKVEESCKPNFYHNSLHNACVAHQALTLLGLMELRFSLGDIEEVGITVAALCHDIGHPGKNNSFMVNACTRLALIYNDISVLENMHASLTFRLLSNPQLNILKHLETDTFRVVKKNMIEMILGTDMKLHFESLSSFRLRRETDAFDPVAKCEDRQRTLCMVLKTADVGHGGLQWEMHEKWCEKVMLEFWDQGEAEKRMGLPVSFLCDRTQHETEYFKSQAAFLEFVVKPLFLELEAVERIVASREATEASAIATSCLALLKNNLDRWQEKERQRLENPVKDT